jgi:hypothetical protein
VVAGADEDARHILPALDLPAHAEGEIDQRLTLVFRRMLLGVGVEDRALGVARRGQRHDILRLGAIEHPGDDAVLAFIDRTRRALAAHGAVNSLHGELAGMARGIGLPGADLALAALAGGGRHMQRLLDGLVDDVGRQAQQRADASGGRWPEMRDMVDLVLVQANRLDQIDLDLVADGEAPEQRHAIGAALLGDREDRRDIVARMAVFGGQEGVVVVEFPHRRTVGPDRPFGMHPNIGPEAEDGRAACSGMGLRLITRRRHRMAVDRSDRHRGVVDDAVDDHLGNCGLDLHRVRRDRRYLPGKLVLPLKPIRLGMNPNLVFDHRRHPLRVVKFALSILLAS